MRVLFDIKTTQKFVGGASEYIRKVFYTLLDYSKDQNKQITIVGLVDSSINNFAYLDLSPKSLLEKGVEVVDLADASLEKIVKEKQIDRIFIGCGQAWKSLDLNTVKCPIICVIHDLWSEEFHSNHLMEFLLLNNYSNLKYNLHRLKQMFQKDSAEDGVREMMRCLSSNPCARIITVSNYSKTSIKYNYGFPEDRISVLYAPKRISKIENVINNPDLNDLLVEGKKFYLMVSTDRITKNADKAIRAFKKFIEHTGNDAFLVTVGYKKKKLFAQQIILPYLSESDLAYAMEGCYAFVYPSIIEGFGYPPVEAMAAGKPILCSNVTSIPEITGDASIQFSPFYESDIFKALTSLNDDNYLHYQEASRERFKIVNKRQEEDLCKLVELLTND